MRLRRFALLAVCCLVPGCASAPPVPDMERLSSETLGSPEASLGYFKTALLLKRDEGVWHQYLCFSEAFKRDFPEKHNGQAFTIEAYTQIRDDIRPYLEEKLGDLEDVEIGDARIDRRSPHLAEVDLQSRDRRETVQMIQETFFHIRWKNPRDKPVFGSLPFGADPITLSANELVFRLPAGDLPPGVGAKDVYRVTYERAWKILGLLRSDLAVDLGHFLAERDAERSGRAPREEPVPEGNRSAARPPVGTPPKTTTPPPPKATPDPAAPKSAPPPGPPSPNRSAPGGPVAPAGNPKSTSPNSPKVDPKVDPKADPNAGKPKPPVPAPKPPPRNVA